MRGNYKQVPVFSATTRFDKAPQSEAERSRMQEPVPHLTAFNAGRLVPLRAIEVLPSQSLSIKFEDIIRQITSKTPTMGQMDCSVFAFFVPNRVVNDSWKNVQGENSSGVWSAPSVALAPLYTGSTAVQIPVGSVADYYGIPTQKPMPAEVLNLMNDLVFRGYLSIYNEYFRDQNYQPPIPYSKANVYEGFLLAEGDFVPLDGDSYSGASVSIRSGDGSVSDGSFVKGSILKSLYGVGSKASDLYSSGSGLYAPSRKTSWSALSQPLKTNKLHDALTSVLPSPQKGPSVTLSLAGDASVIVDKGQLFKISNGDSVDDLIKFKWLNTPANGTNIIAGVGSYGSTIVPSGGSNNLLGIEGLLGEELAGTADLSGVSAISIDDLRLGIAMQQLYELYGRCGSRYRELCHAMFGVDVDDPYSDIPKMLGRVTFPLELYQTAQTSASDDLSPQGNLAAFGYTNKGGFLFHETFLEHGYVHILCTVRQRNIYPAYLDPHWFRINQLDFYTPLLANISEQPVILRTINPFGENPNSTVFGYQEAWWEYRQHPATVSGVLRSGAPLSLSSWTYQDVFDEFLSSADADFMESNAEEVLNPTLAVDSSNAPQFKALFVFYFDNEFPGPVYSVPGLDSI